MLKETRTVFLVLLITCFSITLMGNEPAKNYFPTAVGSFWVYEDQDGNELTRRAVEGEEIAGEKYHAFDYEPSFEDWENYEYHVHPTLFKVDETGIKFHIGDTVKKAYKTRLTKELEVSFESSRENIPPDAQWQPKFDIEIENQEDFYLLPYPITLNEEWDSYRIKPLIEITLNFETSENDPELAGASSGSNIYFTILETGNILAKETVETAAGEFENCLKIEYRTETVMPKIGGGGGPGAGETRTTVWLAPDVGIVKFHQEAEKPILQDTFPNPESTTEVRTFELKKYEIKSDASETE